MPLAEAQTEAWASVLAALEADVAAAEQLLGEHDGGVLARAGLPPAVVRWAAPAGLGPLPERLAERARALAAAQRALAARLQEARSTAADHLAAVRAIPAQRADGPVYLDVRG